MKKIYLFLAAAAMTLSVSAKEDDVIVGGVLGDLFGDEITSIASAGNTNAYGATTCANINFDVEPVVVADKPIDYFTVKVLWHLASDANWVNLKTLCSGSSAAGALKSLVKGDKVTFSAQLPASVVTKMNAETQEEGAFAFIQMSTTGGNAGYSNFYLKDDGFIAASGDCDFGSDAATSVPYVQIADLKVNGVAVSGVSEFTATTFSLTPNPATDGAVVELDGEIADVYNLAGSKVLSAVKEINTGELAAGVYIVKIGTATSKLTVK